MKPILTLLTALTALLLAPLPAADKPAKPSRAGTKTIVTVSASAKLWPRKSEGDVGRGKGDRSI